MTSLSTTQCVYEGCSNNFYISVGISYFKFPLRDKERVKQWQQNCGNIEIASKKVEELGILRICEKHFRKEDINILHSRKTLHRRAIPISYLPNEDISPIFPDEVRPTSHLRTFGKNPLRRHNNSTLNPNARISSRCRQLDFQKNEFCGAIGCNSCSQRDKTISFYLFPKSGTTVCRNGEVIDLRTLWEIQLRCGKAASKSMRACSLHFKKDDFVSIRKGKMVRTHLRKMAIPSQRLIASRLQEIVQSTSKNYASYTNAKDDDILIDLNSECCVPGCLTKTSQAVRFYKFPFFSLEICSIWMERIRRGSDIVIDPLIARICELHFDYRCKTGMNSRLNENSLPTISLPRICEQSSYFHKSSGCIENPQVTVLKDELPHRCRFCFSKGLLYQIESSTYRNKPFISLLNLPPKMTVDNPPPNACLNCLKSIIISDRLSMTVKHSYNVFKILQKPSISKIVLKSTEKMFDLECELALCNLILVETNKNEFQLVDKDRTVKSKSRSANLVLNVMQSYEEKGNDLGQPSLPDKSSFKYVGLSCTENVNDVTERPIYQALTELPACATNFLEHEESNECMMSGLSKGATTNDRQTPSNEFGNEENSLNSIVNQDTLHIEVNDKEIPGDKADSDSSVGVDEKENITQSADKENYCASDDNQLDEKISKSAGVEVIQRIHKCDLCLFSTNYEVNLSRHMTLHSNDTRTDQFACMKFQKKCLNRGRFAAHNRKSHPDDFICKFCGLSVASAEDLSAHTTKHEYIRCEICSTIMKRKFYKYHMKIHNKSDLKLCTLCGKMVKRGHVCSDSRQDYKCRHCSFSSKFRGNFDRHLQLHKGNKRFLCTICAQGFHQKNVLLNHAKQHDQFEKPVTCNFCSKQFNTKYDLRMHSRCHVLKFNVESCEEYWDDVAKVFVCPDCDWKSPSGRLVQGHMHRHVIGYLSENTRFGGMKISSDGPQYQCTECPKVYWSKQNLTIHLVTHTNQKPYKCKLCTSSFATLSRLRNHILEHTDHKANKCTQCNKSFKTLHYLKVHSQKHLGIKFKCEHCEKTYTEYKNMRRHKRSAHNINRRQQ